MRSGSRCIHTGCRRQRLTEGVSERGADATFQASMEASANQIASCKYPIPFMHTREVLIGCCNYDGASAPRFRHALRQALTPTSQSARTHTSHTHTHTRHTPDVCALRSLGHGCVQEVKKLYKYCWFSHTNSSFRVLGHQCVVTMGNCLIWISLCMFFSLL